MIGEEGRRCRHQIDGQGNLNDNEAFDLKLIPFCDQRFAINNSMRQVSRADDDESAVSQKLIDAALEGDESAVDMALSNAIVDVNYMGTVNLSMKHTDSIQHEEAPDELKIDYVQFKTDVTPLFAAAHSGHLDIVRKLLVAGADVNQKLFRGYASTAAAREGHYEVLSILLKAGASQPACEESLMEACLSGQVKVAELLINWEMARPEISTSALIHASSRGLVDVVELLIKNGVDVNSWHRVLLRSIKPALHSSVDCTALIAAIVCRHSSVVKYLLGAGAKTDCQARLGAWSWDLNSGEVLRVGAGMAEPYNAAWCAIEYWEAKGKILRMLLEHVSPNTEQQGRSLLCHAVLCGNAAAVQVLLETGANIEHRVCTKDGAEFRPLHLAAKKGVASVLKTLVLHGCDLNARTETGETSLMLCAVLCHQECFRELVLAGADFAAVNKRAQNVVDIAEATSHGSFIYQIIWDAILSGKKLHSSNMHKFSPLLFVARHGNAEVMKKLLDKKDVDVNQQDHLGYSAAMVTAQEGHMEAFKVLVFSGAHVGLKNFNEETAITLAEGNGNKEHCERVMFDAILANILKEGDFKVLHFAAKRGNSEVLAHALKQGWPINSLDEEGHTPLMLCVNEGHADACKLLLSQGADCHLKNSRGETALALARKNTSGKIVEGVILDHIARKLVLAGGQLSKHTRQGKGSPHMKSVKMLKSGVLRWGESKRRNVLCMDATLGSSLNFQKNRKNRDAGKAGIFRVVTTAGREIHFDAVTAFTAELWVRGVNLITKEAMGTNTSSS